jgi:hypothetical protein
MSGMIKNYVRRSFISERTIAFVDDMHAFENQLDRGEVRFLSLVRGAVEGEKH